MPSSAPQGLPADVILVIDDEPQIRRLVRNALAELDFRVSEASTYHSGLDLAAAERPALIVLDLGLPDGDGLDLCRDLRAFTHVPIIVLSARHSDREKEALLDAGADDYVTKPFSTLELRARIKAQLRRAAATGAGNQDPLVQVQGVTVDLVARTVKRGGEEIHLTPTEWSLLRVFIAHTGQTLTHSQLFSAVWHDGAGDAQQYLRVYVGQLRRKLEVDPVRPRLIRTEPGVGYRFDSGA
ncbi:MAG TPA: response regulator [Gemmatimonadaceae bacterium]|jgi:two-component system KDP operon response regulator KdpE|nr:response regulator [Gemmatimonadaceae bacterium]